MNLRLCLAATLLCMSTRAFEVDTRLPGGNASILGIEGDIVRLKPDIRDSSRWWFYWCFRVTGAAGQTLEFRFPTNECGPVGSRGPCVSTDCGQSWRYATRLNSHSFDYSFGANEDEVWFAQTIPYGGTHWRSFLERAAGRCAGAVEPGVLCSSLKGRPVDKARIGCLGAKPKYRVFIAARHHSAETMASYLVEGLLSRALAGDEAGEWFRKNVEFMVVPFVDKDGVEDGDQGKCRRPHDHNRDYILRRWPEVAAIEDWIRDHAENRLDVFLDVHCPWIDGVEDERFYIWYSREPWNAMEQRRFGRLLESVQRGSMRYRIQDDPRAFGTKRWREFMIDRLLASDNWAVKAIPSLRLGLCFEVPFAVANGATVTEASCRELGEDVAVALRRFLESPAPNHPSADGIYPHLTMFNGAADCGVKFIGEDAEGLEVATCDGFGIAGGPDLHYRITCDRRQTIEMPGSKPAPAIPAGPAAGFSCDAKSPYLNVNGGRFRLPSSGTRPMRENPVVRLYGNGSAAYAYGVFWELTSDFGTGGRCCLRPLGDTLETVTDFLLRGEEAILGIAGGPAAEPLGSTANLAYLPVKTVFGNLTGTFSGAVWKNEDLDPAAVSDAFLFKGFPLKSLYARHAGLEPLRLVFEFDRTGGGIWEAGGTCEVPAQGAVIGLSAFPPAEWIRLRAQSRARGMNAVFVFGTGSEKRRRASRDPLAGISRLALPVTEHEAGVLHCDKRRPDFIWYHSPSDGAFEFEPDLKLHPARNYAFAGFKGDYVVEQTLKAAPLADSSVSEDAASVICVGGDGTRWRLPRFSAYAPAVCGRVRRAFRPGRDLVNLGGILYELPVNDGDCWSRLRPIATHGYAITDFITWNGLIAFAGSHAAEFKVAMIGTVADRLGISGVGGPWSDSRVATGIPSDPYLLNGFPSPILEITSSTDAVIAVEADPDGSGSYCRVAEFKVTAGGKSTHEFPPFFACAWVRLISDRAAIVTAVFRSGVPSSR